MGCSMRLLVGILMGFSRVAGQNLISWKQTYMAALFEVDKSKIVERIEAAQAAVVLRARALFQTSADHQQERKALEAALYALRALRSIADHQSSSPRRKKLAS